MSSGGFSGFGTQKKESLIKETMTLAEVAKLQNDSIPKTEGKKESAPAPAATPAVAPAAAPAAKPSIFGGSSFSLSKPAASGAAAAAPAAGEFVYAGSILNGLIRVAGDFQKDNTPLEGVDVFEKRLAAIESAATKAYVHTVMTLAGELDHGNAAVAEYRSYLETARRDYTLALRPKHTTSPFLQRYVDSIQKRGRVLEDAIDAFDKALDFDDCARSSQSLRDVLIQQQEAIIRCSARLSEIKERAAAVQKEVVAKLRANGVDAAEIERDDADESGPSRAANVREEYEQFLQNRKRDLEKHDLNEEKYKKPVQKSTAFSFGGGTGGGLFGNKSGAK